jgi:mannitol-specific phosphotransferase system IIBC component
MRARRPAIVTILAILQLLTAAAYGMILAALIVGPDTLAGPIGDVLLGEVETATFALVVGGFAVATLAAGILLLRMRQLGWTITMLLSGLGLVSSIAVWWTQATTTPILLFVQVASVFYLNQRQVREAFGISRREAGDALSDAGIHRDGAGATPSEARG